MEEGSAASIWGPFGPAILMNSNEAPWRRNYNFAHEVFHLITWDSIPPGLLSERVDLQNKVVMVEFRNRISQNKIETFPFGLESKDVPT
jgi:hypothetical protein